MKFTGKNVLITGASRGIGADIAKTLSLYGLKVWINYNASETKANKVKEEIEELNINADVETIKFDVNSEEEFIKAFRYISEKDGRLDYLVNNAGITKDTLSIAMSVSEYDAVMNTNARSCFIGCREALKHMARNKFGAVVNISSVTASMGNTGQVNYASSKGAMNSMTKTFSLEGAERGVRFNTISPGLIDTDMTDTIENDTLQSLISKIPLKRFGKTDEISQAVAFLLSDYASYIIGENININGGIYM